MPVLDGWGTIDRLRGDPRFADIPVVIMSGARDIAERAKESGAVAIMYKPIEPQTLIGIIDRFSPRQ